MRSLSKLEIPKNVREIGKYAFLECPFLVTVKLNSNQIEIGEEAFAYCPELEMIDCPSDF